MSDLTLPAAALAATCREFGVRELRLFGSALRADFRADSDIDLLVEFAADRRVGLFHFLRLQQRLAGLLARPVDLVPKDGLKSGLRDRVLAGSRIVYAA